MASLKYYLDKPSRLTSECALYLRYKTLHGNCTFYPQVSVKAEKWDSRAQKHKGTSLAVVKLNQQLVEFRTDLLSTIELLRSQDPQGRDPLPAAVRQLSGRVKQTLADYEQLPVDARAGLAGVVESAVISEQTTNETLPLVDLLRPAATLPELVLEVTRLRRTELRFNSRRQYKYVYNCLLRFRASTDPCWQLRKLSVALLEEWRSWLVSPTPAGIVKRDTRSPGSAGLLVPGGLGVDNQTANNRLAALRSVLSYARQQKLCLPHVLGSELLDVCARKFKKVLLPRPLLSGEQLLQVYQAQLPAHCTASEYVLRDLYCLSWFTSLRQSDVLALGPEHLVWESIVNEQGEVITQPVAVKIASRKSTVSSEVPLHPYAREIILRWLDRDARLQASSSTLHSPQQRGHTRSLTRFRWPLGRIFPQISVNRFEIIKRLFERLSGQFPFLLEPVEQLRSRGAEHERSVVPRWQALTLHTARHGFGTFMAEQNVSIEDTQLLMGHKDIESTRRYYNRPLAQAFARGKSALDSLTAITTTTITTTTAPPT